MKNLIFILVFIVANFSYAANDWKRVECPGFYSNHLQGIAISDSKIFWSYTTKILRTDKDGNIEKIVDAPWHQGDCCVHDGKLYVAVNRGKFNQQSGAKNFVYIYDLNLNFEKEIPIDEMEGGLGGMEYYNGSFYLVGGVDKSEEKFKIYKFSKDFKLEKIYYVPIGNTVMGVQTICRAYGKFWLGCYLQKGKNDHLWEADDDFNVVKKHTINASCGIAPIESDGGSKFLIAISKHSKDRPYAPYSAYAHPVKVEIK